MSIINSQPIIGASGNQVTGYNLTRSLRFRSSASAYLNRSIGSTTNQKTYTYSYWVKRGSLSSSQDMVRSQLDGNNVFQIMWYQDNIFVQDYQSAVTLQLQTTAVYRDPSAWYHIVFAVDTTQATSTNRLKLYVNGVQVTAFSASTYPSQNTNTNVNKSGTPAYIGYGNALDGYIAEFNFIDGQALTPSDFGETDTATGVWKPKKYTGTYGTNGFYLKFDNLTSTSTLGNDSSGNSNTWTVNNISLTSGSTYDSMKDVPTLTDADTANYCVLNPLQASGGATISGANMYFSQSSASAPQIIGTLGVTTGKFYFETTINAIASGGDQLYGITDSTTATQGYPGYGPNSYGAYCYTGNAYVQSVKNNSFVNTDLGVGTANDVIQIAFDMDAGKFWIGKNNTWANSGNPATGANPTLTGITGTQIPCFRGSGNGNASSAYVNFGQRPFAYTPPSGFKALNTFNLPTPTIGATASTQANDYFDVSLWTGTGSSQSITNSGGFQPDFVWGKIRSGADYHVLTDAVRGNTKFLKSNTTDAEITETQNITSFNSNGFTIGTSTDLNRSTYTFVGWQWKANGAGSTNTAGSQTSTVSVNTTAGFSIATFTCTGLNVNGTVGHGLGVAPNMIITKSRGSGSNWVVYHSSVSTDVNKFLRLNDTSATVTLSNVWGDALPTSTVFGIRGDVTLAASATAVAYCFAEVAGYSKFGSLTGNGSTEGPFVFTGFRPKYIMIKRSDSTSNWGLYDSSRSTYNANSTLLLADTNDAEATYSGSYPIDFLSNGFKVRNTSFPNANGGTYIYAAFAEHPFKYSLAR